MDRLLAGTAGTVAIVTRGPDGLPLDATGDVTATVRDGAGLQVQTGVAIRTAPGTYQITVPAAITLLLDQYAVTWQGTFAGSANTYVTHFSTVGGFMFSTAELRAAFEELASAAKYPEASLQSARREVEDSIQVYCGASFVPRARRAVLSGDGSPSLVVPDLWPRVVKSAYVGGVPLTGAELADLAPDETGIVIRASLGTWSAGTRNVSIHYEYGWLEPPADLRWAAIQAARGYVVRNPVPQRALSESTDVGVVRFAIAGRDGCFGVPDADAVIDRYRFRVPRVA